jgi:hypothetical protein
MPLWKRIFLKAAGFGAGAVAATAIVGALFFWYTTRPVKLKPWNRGAITADYYRVTTSEQPDSKLEFEYVLENKTDMDYELQKYSAPRAAARLEDTNSLTGFADENGIVLKLPVFVPAHQKTRISITTPSYGFSALTQLTSSSTLDERLKYYAEVAAYVTKRMSNLNGFVLFDESNRYQVDLPSGWKKETEANERKVADKQLAQQKKQ